MFVAMTFWRLCEYTNQYRKVITAHASALALGGEKYICMPDDTAVQSRCVLSPPTWCVTCRGDEGNEIVADSGMEWSGAPGDADRNGGIQGWENEASNFRKALCISSGSGVANDLIRPFCTKLPDSWLINPLHTAFSLSLSLAITIVMFWLLPPYCVWKIRNCIFTRCSCLYFALVVFKIRRNVNKYY